MIIVGDKIYNLEYNIKTIKVIERYLGKGLMLTLGSSNFALGLEEFSYIFGCALFNEDGNRVGITQAQEIAEAYLEETSYQEAVTTVRDKLMEDCPFLFQVS